ncbi:ABC transporter permease [Nakamurella sp.]|uniref:ABC transporter permease n=1 Tax=Nakamurella sp. TaxID=1869182 RepID=UPI00378458BD
MTAATVPRSDHEMVRGGRLTGTGPLVRLALRRERIPLVAWVVGIGLVAASTFSAITALYPQAAERTALVQSIAVNPAFLAITGPITGTSVGAISAWRVTAVGTSMVALMAVFTVIRRTRADEETGRIELLASSVVGRAAPLTAAVAVAIGASLAIGLLTAAAGVANGQDVAGSLAFGGAMAGCGVAFAGVAAITAQLAESSRTAVGLACSAVGVTYALRAVGDVNSSLSWLTWLSPQGWAGHIQAYGENNLWILGLFVALGAVTLVVAVRLLDHRDLGLGLVAARLGPATNPQLATPEALAARLHRGTLIGWLVGMVAMGVVTGAVSSTSAGLLTDNPQLEQVMAQIGGTGAIADTLLSVMGGLTGLIVGGYAIATALRMRGEETADRVGPVLATAVGRTRWMAGHLTFVVLGPAALLVAAGTSAGVVNSIEVGSFADGFGGAFGAMLVQLPATLVFGGIAVALFGLVPRLTGLAWAALVVALLLGQLGELLQLPRWVMDASPYTHVPQVPVVELSWAPMIGLTVVAVAFMAAGIVGFTRRDVS